MSSNELRTVRVVWGSSLPAALMRICALALITGCSDNPASGTPRAWELRGAYLGQTPPGRTPEVFAPGIVSHGFHENGIVFSSDGNELYFSTSDSKYAAKTFICMSQEHGLWSVPELCSFSGRFYDHSAFLSPGEDTLYFSSTRPVPSRMDSTPNLDVWLVAREETSWGEPIHLTGPLNTEFSEQITSIASNGTIYLRANYEGPGQWAIYRSRRENGLYQAAEKLSDTINSGNFEGNPFIAPDESFLIFKSSRPGGYGNTDLYVSFNEPDGSWGVPINMGPDVNSPENELEPRLSPDGRYLFFTSFRKHDPDEFNGIPYSQLLEMYRSPQNGYGTLYWMSGDIIASLRESGL